MTALSTHGRWYYFALAVGNCIPIISFLVPVNRVSLRVIHRLHTEYHAGPSEGVVQSPQHLTGSVEEGLLSTILTSAAEAASRNSLGISNDE
jgi:hypothetical protein